MEGALVKNFLGGYSTLGFDLLHARSSAVIQFRLQHSSGHVLTAIDR